jgi:hypothetical protein
MQVIRVEGGESMPAEVVLPAAIAQRRRPLTGRLERLLTSLAQREAHSRTIALQELSPAMRRLALFGYIFIAVLLGAVLSFEVAHARFPGVVVGTAQLSYPAVAVAAAAHIVGWAFFMTGVTYFRRRWLVLSLVLFVGDWIAINASADTGGPIVFVPLVLMAIPVTLAFMRNRRWGHALPLMEFGCWAAIGLVQFAIPFSLRGTTGLVAAIIVASRLTAVLAIPFALVLSLEVVELGVFLGRRFTTGIRQRLGDQLAPWVALPIVAFPLVSVPWLIATSGSFGDGLPAYVLAILILMLLFNLLVALVAAVVWLAGRWSGRSAATVQAVVVALLVMVVCLTIGATGKDLIELPLSVVAIFPPTFLFASVLAFNVLSLGARYCNRDSARMPRLGRILGYFGLAILITSWVLVESNYVGISSRTPEVETGLLANRVIGQGVLWIGFPYLLWIAWKHRDHLVGESLPVSEPVRGGGKALLSVVLAILGLLLSWIPFLGLPLPIAAFLLGWVAFRSPRRGRAISGMILSAIGVAVNVLVTVLALANP